LTETPETFEDGAQATVDNLKELNLETNEELHPIYASSSLALEEEKHYLSLLSEYKDVFSWSYKKLPGLDPNVAVHHLSTLATFSPRVGAEN